MAIPSVEIPLGTNLPPFRLPDPQGSIFDSASLMGSKGLLVVFTCNHCPYAQGVWPQLIALAGDHRLAGVRFVGINPNIHPDYPEDSPQVMADRINEWRINFPYLVDASQDVARAFKAQCTPDIFLFDKKEKLVYHGRVDDNWQEPSKVTRHELRNAIEQLIQGNPIDARQHPTIGCSIKWRTT